MEEGKRGWDMLGALEDLLHLRPWLVCACVRHVCARAHVWGNRKHFHQHHEVSWWWVGWFPRQVAPSTRPAESRTSEVRLSPTGKAVTMWRTHNVRTVSHGDVYQDQRHPRRQQACVCHLLARLTPPGGTEKLSLY